MPSYDRINVVYLVVFFSQKLLQIMKYLMLKFANRLSRDEIVPLRGAINAAMAEGHSIYFHNHTGLGLRYSYPLIQYKSIDGKAAIVSLEDGTEAMMDFFLANIESLRVRSNLIRLEQEKVRAEDVEIAISQDWHTYQITDWLPLNSRNHQLYCATQSMIKRIEMLERILTGNILSMLKGLGIFADEQIQCQITDMEPMHTVEYKEVKLSSLNLTFRANIELPDYIGLGKEAATGFGVIRQIKNKR